MHAKFGMLRATIKEIEENVEKRSDGKPKQPSERQYNARRQKPLLLIYELETRHENKLILNQNVVSIVVHFPEDDGFNGVQCTYAINKIKQQLELFTEDDSDEAKDLEASQEEL